MCGHPIWPQDPKEKKSEPEIKSYGLSTSNTRSYRRHYLAWHSHVVVLADADTLLLAAETLCRALARPATAA